MCQNGNFNIYNNGPPFRMDLHTHLQHCAWMRFCHQWLDNWHVITDIIVVVTGFRWKWDYCSRTERLTRRSSCKVRVPKVPQKATDTPLCVCVCPLWLLPVSQNWEPVQRPVLREQKSGPMLICTALSASSSISAVEERRFLSSPGGQYPSATPQTLGTNLCLNNGNAKQHWEPPAVGVVASAPRHGF